MTAGANMGFVNAVLAITDPGDEIILNLPYYFNHEMAIAMADCKAVCVPTDENYQLQPDLPSRSAITEPDAGGGHDLAEQSDRGRLPAGVAPPGQRPLPPARHLSHLR